MDKNHKVNPKIFLEDIVENGDQGEIPGEEPFSSTYSFANSVIMNPPEMPDELPIWKIQEILERKVDESEWLDHTLNEKDEAGSAKLIIKQKIEEAMRRKESSTYYEKDGGHSKEGYSR